MRLSGNTMLITGGTDGIGLEMAKRFLKLGNKVIICGRSQKKYEKIKREFPELNARIADLSSSEERKALVDWVLSEFPDVNMLFNNAGMQVQRDMNLMTMDKPWSFYQMEVAVNIEAPFDLTIQFLPHFAKKEYAAIVNVTSGLAFVPRINAPIYCAAKAALHSWTLSTRMLTARTGIEVIEVVPCSAKTNLGSSDKDANTDMKTDGVSVYDLVDGIFKGFEDGLPEIGYGTSIPQLRMSRDEIDESVRVKNKALLDKI